MSYTIGSGKDSRQDVGFTELDFMNRFAQHRDAIEQYKKQHGGDLEGAYQAVTGEPWPSGRSVKIHDGQPEMTKDRTVKSVLGKYVAAPAAIGATAIFAPAALPAIAHGIGTGAAAVGHALAPLVGMGGEAGGAAAGGGVAGGGLGTGALAAGATVPGAGMVSGIGGGLTAASGVSAASKGLKFADTLRSGGEMLTNGARESANEDAANNVGAANWLRTMDDDYKTKLDASINVPAGLQKQALWSDYIQNAQSSDPNAPKTNLLKPGQQDMVAAQKAAILAKLAEANKMGLPTAPETPKYQQPGAGTKAASYLGTGMQIASKIPWGKIL